ncbi:hypothetical protein CALVIDRAFT_348338 [Calocera viscosa TUFC12733]|uniref:Uncharacterized protein n=1 Tax=Calocera viscosa (strain TUFC12733) TaxID=1330018 RepID=A0A167H8X2_CALVF|nr:hypothetical protein CALVIDRAFT_348338 [Calocera viscosa TUFC12733]
MGSFGGPIGSPPGGAARADLRESGAGQPGAVPSCPVQARAVRVHATPLCFLPPGKTAPTGPLTTGKKHRGATNIHPCQPGPERVGVANTSKGEIGWQMALSRQRTPLPASPHTPDRRPNSRDHCLRSSPVQESDSTVYTPPPACGNSLYPQPSASDGRPSCLP